MTTTKFDILQHILYLFCNAIHVMLICLLTTAYIQISNK